MKNIKEFPPNIEKIKTLFAVDKDVAFCYGNVIYNPYDIILKEHQIVHESVHYEQQKAVGGPEVWWNKYIADPVFRIDQEGQAYGCQLKFIRIHFGAEAAMQSLHSFANFLSSPVYGSAIDYSDSRELIRKWAYGINKNAYI